MMMQRCTHRVSNCLALDANNLLFCDKFMETMFVHGSRIRKQFEYLNSLDIDIQPLYKQTGLKESALADPGATFDFEIYRMVLEFALRQTGNPEYGLDFGNQAHVGGTIGMLCASCRNLKEAFIQGCGFMHLQGDFATLRFVEDAQDASMNYELADSWKSGQQETARVEIDAMFAFLNAIIQINSNHTLHAKAVRFAYEAPEDEQKYHRIFGVKPEFNATENEMVFDPSVLKIPMKAFNPETFQLLNAHLKSESAKMKQSVTTTDKVKKVLHHSFRYHFPDIDTVASRLMVSPRTLQRKLSEEDTTYQQIVQETRFELAAMLLQQDTLSVSEISLMLGYSDVANFSRSFKKHTGMSPQTFRTQGK